MSKRFLFLLLATALSITSGLMAALPDEPSAANSSTFSAPEIWYNRGLAEEKSGDAVAASLSFRRAVLLDPTLLPARTQLNSVLTALGIPVNSIWSDKLFMQLHPDLLILGGAVLGWLGVLALVFLLLSANSRKSRSPGLIALALLAVILGHGASLVGTWSDPRRLAMDEGIVSAKGEQILRATPADSAQADGTLVPGSLVTILSRNGAWWKVSCGNAKTGWISSTAITPLLPVTGS